MITGMDGLAAALTVAAAVGSGLVGGIFLIFSITIVPALDRQPPAAAVAVMRTINRVILAPAFLVPFVGTVPICVALVVLRPGDPAAVAGAIAYVVGAFVLTRVVNVPLNEALDAATGDPARAWQAFRPRWMIGNHVRTVAALAAAVLLTVAA